MTMPRRLPGFRVRREGVREFPGFRVRREGPRRLQQGRWGYILAWAIGVPEQSGSQPSRVTASPSSHCSTPTCL